MDYMFTNLDDSHDGNVLATCLAQQGCISPTLSLADGNVTMVLTCVAPNAQQLVRVSSDLETGREKGEAVDGEALRLLQAETLEAIASKKHLKGPLPIVQVEDMLQAMLWSYIYTNVVQGARAVCFHDEHVDA